jgi:chorismate-pyruvate lyase
LRELLRDLRKILARADLDPDRKLAAVAAGVRAVIAQVPPAGPSPATRLAIAMRTEGRPFTLLAAEAAGEEVRVKLNRTEDRPPNDQEWRLLSRPGKVRCRAGHLYLPGSGLVIAQVTSAVNLFRLDAFARAELASGDIPLGAVLAALPGARRETLEARETSDGRVLSSARMHAGGWPVALATEVVTAEFAAMAGNRLP